MDFYTATSTLSEILGEPTWSGADSRVWKCGNYVIKVMSVPPNWWRNMRALSKTSGPFAPILDMKVVGFNYNGYIVGFVVQPYRRASSAAIPYDSYLRFPTPEKWYDGNTWWEQVDDGPCNTVEGAWVDLARIFPIQEKFFPAEVRYAKRIAA